MVNLTNKKSLAVGLADNPVRLSTTPRGDDGVASRAS